MSRPRVTIDKYTPDSPVRVEFCGSTMHYSRDEAHALYERLGGVLMELDPPDTMPPPASVAPPAGPSALFPADAEPDTTPDTPIAIRRSSDQLRAVDLSDTKGLAARVAAELAEGKTPSRR